MPDTVAWLSIARTALWLFTGDLRLALAAEDGFGPDWRLTPYAAKVDELFAFLALGRYQAKGRRSSNSALEAIDPAEFWTLRVEPLKGEDAVNARGEVVWYDLLIGATAFPLPDKADWSCYLDPMPDPSDAAPELRAPVTAAAAGSDLDNSASVPPPQSPGPVDSADDPRRNAIRVALDRGDRPGHHPSWGKFHSELLKACSAKEDHHGFGLRQIQRLVKAELNRGRQSDDHVK